MLTRCIRKNASIGVDMSSQGREQELSMTGIAKHGGPIGGSVENRQPDSGVMQSQEAAKATSGVAGEFLANISHDMRTPMTAILGFAGVLLENVHEPACIDAAIAIKRNSCYLLNLVNNIGDLSKLEAGELAVQQAPCSPIHSVADIASVMRIRAQMKHLSLQTEFVGPIPETIVTDPVRLRQILINLVGNAVRFTELGSVRLVTRLCREQGQPPKLQFDVIDTGIGIRREHAATLFEPAGQRRHVGRTTMPRRPDSA